MWRIEDYLGQFEDFELAFFWKYKLDTYMKYTQKEIKAYLKKKRLSDAEMKNLIAEYSKKTFPENEFRCPRCKSKKIISEKEKAFNSMNGYKLAEELIDYEGINTGNIDCTCAVCGLFFSLSQNYSFFRKVFNIVVGSIFNIWN